jgi:hypothetical protein
MDASQKAWRSVFAELSSPEEEGEADEAQRRGHEVVLRKGEGEPVREVEARDLVGGKELPVVEDEHLRPEAGEPARRPERVA